MGAAVDELVRAVEPEEIKIEVAIENPHVTKSPQDTPPGNWGAHPANLNKNVENVDFKLTGADKREKIVTDDADVQVLADK